MKILLLSHAFPPLSTIASHRAYGWARSWAAAGHAVHVLTPVKSAIDGPLDLDLPLDGIHVHAVGFGGRASTTSGRGSDDGRAARWARLRQRTRWLRHKLGLLGDIRLMLVPGLVRAGRRIVAGQGFDVIVGAYGPASIPIAAALLARKTGIPWVVDYQDLWSENYVQPRSSVARRLSLAFERLVIRRAALLVTLSHGLARRIHHSLGREAVVAYFGYLEDDDDPPAATAEPAGGLIYAGRVYERHQTVARFFRALAAAMAQRPGFHPPLAFYGPDQDALAAMLGHHRLTATVRLNGLVAQQHMLTIERGATALLFFDWIDPAAEGVLTGKLFEYLRVGRPIVFIGAGFETEASALARRSGLALVLQTDAEIVSWLMRWPADLPEVRPDADFIAALSNKRQAAIVLAAIRQAIAPWKDGGAERQDRNAP